MKTPQVISALITATSADLLGDTELGTAPGPGSMVFEFSADTCDATNNLVLNLALPGGDTPMNGVLIPAAGAAGTLDTRTKLQATYPVNTGGKFQVSVTETGTVVGIYRISWVPLAMQ